MEGSYFKYSEGWDGLGKQFEGWDDLSPKEEGCNV